MKSNDKISQDTPKKNNNLLKVFKRYKLLFLIMLFFLLVSNTFAWFLYNKVVSADISGSVRAWDVKLDGSANSEVVFEIDELYPGMSDFDKSLNIENNGGSTAMVSLTLNSFTLFGVEYKVGNTYTDEAGVSKTYTEEDLLNIFSTYPFKMSFNVTDSELSPGQAADIIFHVDWPYESGNDELDTYYGQEAYNFKEANPSGKAIIIKIGIESTQKAE